MNTNLINFYLNKYNEYKYNKIMNIIQLNKCQTNDCFITTKNQFCSICNNQKNDYFKTYYLNNKSKYKNKLTLKEQISKLEQINEKLL